MLIIPIMNDVLGDIGVASCWNRLEETARLDLEPPAAFRDALRFHAGNDLWKVVEHARHLRVSLQYRDKQESVTAAHIRDALDAAEIIGIENGTCLESGV